MTRHWLMLHVTVKDGERAFLTRNGVRQESWQRIGGASPHGVRTSHPPRPRVMRGVPRGPT